jgi:antitoxin component YwqK of YwqJK toxin-antitoxin module
MKLLLYLLFILLFISCKDDINNSTYRNSNYVFYKTDGESGVWQKIIENSNNKYKPGILTYFFDNGKVFATTKILDSFPNRIVDFYNDKKIVTTYFYKNNVKTKTEKREGFQTEYLSNKGIITGKGFIKNNLEQGEWELYDNDNILKSVVNYKNGLKHGDVKEFYSDGNIKTLGKMWHGKKQDTINWFYNDGKLKIMEITEIDTINKVSKGIVYHYYNNGTLHKKIPVINEKSNGLSEIYYDNGKLKSISNYSNGILNGDGIGYHQSGAMAYKGKTINNNIHGDFSYYNKKGNLIKIVKYNHGQILDSILY